MVNESEWGESSPADALFSRLKTFLPTSESSTIFDCLSVGYPLFGVDSNGTSRGINQSGSPFLITKTGISTDRNLEKMCPKGRETAVIEAMKGGKWQISEDLHIRVWSDPPKKATDEPNHPSPEIVQSFKDAGIHSVEFMNAVNTVENSMMVPGIKAGKNLYVSKPFYEEWKAAMLSGDPYLCFFSEKSQARTVQGLSWFQSKIGMSYKADNRKFTQSDLDAKQSFKITDDNIQAIWLLKVVELAKADLFMRKNGDQSPLGLEALKCNLEGVFTNIVIKKAKKNDKSKAYLLECVGTRLIEMVRGGESSLVLEAISDMQKDDDLSEWWTSMKTMGEQVCRNGLNINF